MSRNRDNLDRAVAAWNAGDLEGYLTLYHERIQLHGYTPAPLDKPGVRGFYQMIHSTLTAAGAKSPTLRLEGVIEQDDRIAARFVLTGEHQGPFMGVPSTGRSIALPGITIMHFRDGRVVERWSSADMLGLLAQIGAWSPPDS
jgi:predicted ester cyclase